MKRAVVMIVLWAAMPAALWAGPIQSACLRSDRQAATRPLCACIDTVAERMLSGSDQRRAAKFFSDPARSQEVRQSDRASDEAFWRRYKAFVVGAEVHCGPPE